MSNAAKKVLEVALALPEEDRRRLGEALLDSIALESPNDIEQAWVAEAVRRAEEVARGEGELLDLDASIAEIRASISQP